MRITEQNLAAESMKEPKQLSSAEKIRSLQLRWRENNVPITLRPIRLIQLIIDVVLLSLTVFLWTITENPLGITALIILTFLFASFVIVMSIDAIGHLGRRLVPDLPMFLIVLLGLVLFTSAAQAVLCLLIHQESNNSSVIAMMILCLVAALLFLLDTMIMIIYWRYTYTKKSGCPPCSQLYQKPSTDVIRTLQTNYKHWTAKPITRETSTSFSWREENKPSLSTFGNVGIGERRQYVDSPTSPDTKFSPKLVETQTDAVESAKRTDNETSTIVDAEEKNAQTLSQCPVCSTSLDYSPDGICPSFLAMYQNFEMFCCDQGPIAKIKQEPPLLVERGTLAGSNCSFKSTESTIFCTKKSPRVYETRCCPTHGAGLIAQRAGLPSPVKRISLPHSIRKSKKTQTSSPKPMSVMDQNTEIDAAIGTEEVMIKQPSIEEAFSSSPKVIHSFASSNGFEPMQENLLRESINIKTEERTNEISSCSLQESNVSPPVEKSRISESSKEGEKVSAEEIVLSEEGSLDTEKRDEELNVDSKSASTSRKNIFQSDAKIETITPVKTSPIKGASSISAVINAPIENLVDTEENRKHSADSKDAQPKAGPFCNCSNQYYYKDVFGRNICNHCADKYLIKIPHRRTTIQPSAVANIKCCACSQAIFHQTPDACQARNRRCGKCSRYQMYASTQK